MKQIDFLSEIIVDCFAGGGGASTGIELATGRPVDIAINHDPDAIAMHKANHPYSEHYQDDIYMINPKNVTRGRPVGWAHFSPDCKHFSRAKGCKPVSKQIRGLAWIVLRWAGMVRPRIISLENVPEFLTWGPVKKGKPIKKKKGLTFNRFIYQLEALGYTVEWRELVACDYGAPTSRKRLFVIARCDGVKIVWPKKTHGKTGDLIPYKTAADIIDWTIPCPSIFTRNKPLAENTLKRIARGLDKFVFNDPEPFIMQAYGGGYNGSGRSTKEPLPTVTVTDHNYLMLPYLTAIGQTGFSADRSRSMDYPLSTIVTKQEHLIVTPFIAQYHSYDGKARGSKINDPIQTIDTSNRYAVIAPYMLHLYDTSTSRLTKEPVSTTTPARERIAQVQAFLIKYYGQGTGQSLNEPLDTVVSKDRFGLIVIKGKPYQIIDIGMRMLTPRELYLAQGFPDDYIIEHDCTGKPYSKTKQVARCGNAVPPPFMTSIVKSNWSTCSLEKSLATMKDLKQAIIA